MLFDAVSSYFFAVVKKKIGIFISICFQSSPSEKLSPRRWDEKKVKSAENFQICFPPSPLSPLSPRRGDEDRVESTRFVVKSVEKISKSAKDFHENAIYR